MSSIKMKIHMPFVLYVKLQIMCKDQVERQNAFADFYFFFTYSQAEVQEDVNHTRGHRHKQVT